MKHKLRTYVTIRRILSFAKEVLKILLLAIEIIQRLRL